MMMMMKQSLLLFVVLATTLEVASSAQADWWPTVQQDFANVEPELKECGKRIRRNKIPVDMMHCGRTEKTCFFETVPNNTCGETFYPDRMCVCKQSMWNCTDLPCPEEPAVDDTPEETTSTVDQAPPNVFSASIGRAYPNVQMNLLTNDVLSGYETVEELCDDLNMTVRFFMNAFIEQQSRYNPFLFPVFEDAFGPPEFTVALADDAQGVNSPSAEGATDFETNNQEEGVDEADTVKSDGTYVYAVYGDALVIWEALTGDPVTNYTLPAIADTNTGGGGGGFGGGGGDFLIADAAFLPYTPKPQIRGISLEAERLVLYAQGYGNEVRAASETTSVFSNAYDTRIIVLDTSSLPSTINVVTQKDVHGSYRDARAIGDDTIHVVTTCNINYNSLQSPIYRFNSVFEGLNDTEYIAAAAAIAEPLIDEFVTSLKDDVILLGMPSIPKISIWQTDLGNNTNMVEDIYSNGAINAFVQITSFNVAAAVGDELTVSTSGAFTPSSWGYTYAVDGNLVFAAQGYNWNPFFGGSAQTTYLLGFTLNGASATPSFLGSVPGYINNQFFLNIYNGTLSVATTMELFWPPFVPEPVVEGEFTIFPQPVFTTNNTVYVYNLPTETEPMTEAGRVENLGKPGERFTAVRFFGHICYAVTFRQIDPFYVVSTKPGEIGLLGELEITGFSSYMHSINDDNTLIVGVGQEADEFGQILGIQLSLFDATIPSAPTLLDRHVVEEEPDVWSSSTVQWDYKAFRYLPLGPEVGIIIIPLQVRSFSRDNLDGNFDGWLAYDVSRQNGISPRLNVTHVASTDDFYGCYYQANLPQRSLVFNGNVTTMKGHSVISTDLDTGATTWTLDMDKPVEEEDCGFWFF